MQGCEKNVLKKKWFKHFHPILAVAFGQDLKDELIPGGELTLNLWRCIQRVISEKDKRMYRGWLDRWRGIFDPRFVDELCKGDDEMDWDYISMMMNSKVMGYRVNWLKKILRRRL